MTTLTRSTQAQIGAKTSAKTLPTKKFFSTRQEVSLCIFINLILLFLSTNQNNLDPNKLSFMGEVMVAATITGILNVIWYFFSLIYHGFLIFVNEVSTVPTHTVNFVAPSPHLADRSNVSPAGKYFEYRKNEQPVTRNDQAYETEDNSYYVPAGNYDFLTASRVCNAFMANYLAALLLIQVKDSLAVTSLLRDEDYSPNDPHTGSRLNFWGYFLFNSNFNKSSQHLLNSTTYSQLAVTAGRIIEGRSQFIFISISRRNNMVQNWQLQHETIKLMLMRLDIYEPGLESAIDIIINWDFCNTSQKSYATDTIRSYLNKYDDSSPLSNRLKRF